MDGDAVPAAQDRAEDGADGAGILLVPDDQPGLCQAMLSLYRDDALRADLSTRSLRQAARFSWAENLRQTLAVYRLATAERASAIKS